MVLLGGLRSDGKLVRAGAAVSQQQGCTPSVRPLGTCFDGPQRVFAAMQGTLLRGGLMLRGSAGSTASLLVKSRVLLVALSVWSTLQTLPITLKRPM